MHAATELCLGKVPRAPGQRGAGGFQRCRSCEDLYSWPKVFTRAAGLWAAGGPDNIRSRDFFFLKGMGQAMGRAKRSGKAQEARDLQEARCPAFLVRSGKEKGPRKPWEGVVAS